MKIVVIIDDDQIARALLAECLSGDNWRVIEAEDGEAGFDLVLQHRPHAVVCDIRIPKRNGFLRRSRIDKSDYGERQNGYRL